MISRIALVPCVVLALGVNSETATREVELLRQPSLDSISLDDVGIHAPSQAVLAGAGFVWLTGPQQGIAVVDVSSGRARSLGAIGSGPGEFRQVSRVFGCAGSAGWLDAELSRATWIQPDGRGAPHVTALPATTVARGKLVDAWCLADTLWYSFERETSARSPLVSDTLLIFRVARTGGSVDTVARIGGTRRVVRNQGALRTSTRVPYTSSPVAVPGSKGPIVLWRSVDSMSLDVARSGQPSASVRGGRGAQLTARHVALLKDSIKAAREAEMEAVRYPEDLRREFRRVHDAAIDAIPVPATLPTVRMAVPIPGRANHALVIENAMPTLRDVCFAVLSPSGLLGDRSCYQPLSRTFGAAVHTGQDIWLAEWNDDGAWLRRQSSK
jgi:hypothetical protein